MSILKEMFNFNVKANVNIQVGQSPLNIES